jgi:RNA 3'-terminal phosphate cyclase
MLLIHIETLRGGKRDNGLYFHQYKAVQQCNRLTHGRPQQIQLGFKESDLIFSKHLVRALTGLTLIIDYVSMGFREQHINSLNRSS